MNYFLPDSHKSGGSYQTVTGRVRLIDDNERAIELTDGRRIPLDMVRSIHDT